MGRVVAIIGTAGRGEIMTRGQWRFMVRDAKTKVREDDWLVSGGAAWADHVAVRLFTKGYVEKLTLYLPAPLKDGKFDGDRGTAGSAANYYHRLFTQDSGVHGIEEIVKAGACGAHLLAQPVRPGMSAFFVRNALVAKLSTHCIAYTFGTGDEPADGGTLNTWKQIKGERVHVSLKGVK